MANIKIKAVNRSKGQNRFCGPAVISAVTGCTTDDAAALIRLESNRTMITGTTTSEVRRTMLHWGIYLTNEQRLPKQGRPTLARWLRDNKAERTAGRVYLIVAGNHWQLVSGRRYVCGISGDVVSIKDKVVKRRARVSEIYELEAYRPIKLRDRGKALLEKYHAKKAIAKAESSRRAKASRVARQLAAQLDVTIEAERNEGRTTYWVSPGKSWREDPIDDGHFGYCMHEVLEIVQTYQQAESTHRH